MQLKTGIYCPLIKSDCKQMACSWFMQIRGRHPQTGADLDEWMCAVAATPLLQMAVAQEVRHGAAETNALRTDVAKANERSSFMGALVNHAGFARGYIPLPKSANDEFTNAQNEYNPLKPD
jgi:hypothetical protein